MSPAFATTSAARIFCGPLKCADIPEQPLSLHPTPSPLFFCRRYRAPDPSAQPAPPPVKDFTSLVMAAKRKAKPGVVGTAPLAGIMNLKHRAAKAVTAVDSAVATAFRVVFHLPLSEREVRRRLDRIGSVTGDCHTAGLGTSVELPQEEEVYGWQISVEEQIAKKSAQQQNLIAMLCQHGAGARAHTCPPSLAAAAASQSGLPCSIHTGL